MSDSGYKIGRKLYMYDDLTNKWFESESGSFVRGKKLLKQLEDATGLKNMSGKNARTVKTAGSRQLVFNQLKRNYGKYFSNIKGKRSVFSNAGGRIEKWAKPLTLRGGNNPNFGWGRAEYRHPITGKVIKGTADHQWGSNVNSNVSASVFVGMEQWIYQLRIALHSLSVSAESFRVLVGQRAIRVFQNSFKYRKFYTKGSHHWKPLSDRTIYKRLKRRTGTKILREYGDLFESIKLDTNVRPGVSRVYTDIVSANAKKHKYHNICYAGFHNEGRGTYGKRNGKKGKPYIKRQFMGHSTYLDPYSDPFMRKMMKLYLFDSVFKEKKA